QPATPPLSPQAGWTAPSPEERPAQLHGPVRPGHARRAALPVRPQPVAFAPAQWRVWRRHARVERRANTPSLVRPPASVPPPARLLSPPNPAPPAATT